MSQLPIWVFEADHESAPCASLADSQVQVVPLDLPHWLRPYYFADKVHTCAMAEDMVDSGCRSLIWIDTACLVIQPPELYLLGPADDAALRPVHITNVGLPHDAPLDGFWKGIYADFGVPDIEMTVRVFVDGLTIRAYFNTHAFTVDPSKGLLRLWREHFETMVRDEEYQRRFCRDEAHRVFLHQAVFSTLLATSLNAHRLRLLPPEYNYPYNLQLLVPLDRRAKTLNDLVSLTYEDRIMDPGSVEDIEILEPLRTWLTARVPA